MLRRAARLVAFAFVLALASSMAEGQTMPAKLEVRMLRTYIWQQPNPPWVDTGSAEIELEIPANGSFGVQSTVTHRNTPTIPGAVGATWTCKLIAPATSTLTIRGQRDGINLNLWPEIAHPGVKIHCSKEPGHAELPDVALNWQRAADEVKLYFADNAQRNMGPGVSPAGGWLDEYKLRLACPVTVQKDLPPVSTRPSEQEGWPIIYNYELTLTSLTKLARMDPQNYEVRGYTTPDAPWPPTIEFADKASQSAFGDGSCYWVESVTIVYPPIDIYVASEFAQNVCARQAIVEHEMLHYSDITQAIRQGSSQLKKVLEEIVASLPAKNRPIFVKSPDAAHQEVAEKIKTAVGAQRQRYAREVKTQTGQLKAQRDTPAAMQRLGQRVDECMRLK